MEILTPPAHRALLYLEAVNRQGQKPSSEQLDAYAKDWKPRQRVEGGYAQIQAMMDNMTNMGGRTVVEAMTDYLRRVGWLSVSKSGLTITELGKAVLREANTPLPDTDSGSTLEVVIDPDNPFAYAQLMSKITGFGTCMIVDPYLDVEQLMTLAEFHSVTRILTGDSKLSKIKPVYALLEDPAPHVEVRWMRAGSLHDRFMIPADGHVYMLGSSLNSIAKRFGVATTFEMSTSKLIAQQYEELWANATPLRGRAGSVSEAAGAAT
ncbi:hypothetical protein [Pseudarthrobacter oxydans]|uniref:hypothetical protein n=1 Tax=Pseudarthrobacter oxydans TaxID=1671 RepID=UPI00344BF83F